MSTLYPLRVTEAYDGDLAAAARASDDEVAAKVGEWERSQGLDPRDWQAIGRAEREEPERSGTGTDKGKVIGP